MITYTNGTMIRGTATFESDGDLLDPSTVVFKTQSPAGDVQVYTYGIDVEITRVALGVYRFEGLADQDGTWVLRAQSSGSTVAAAERKFKIISDFDDRFVPGYLE